MVWTALALLLALAPTSPALALSLRQAAELSGHFIGAAVRPDLLAGDPAYAATLAGEFNSLVAENHMKWAFVQPAQGSYDFAAADAIVGFAEANGMRVRGHTLIWRDSIPAYLAGVTDPAQLRAILQDHVATVVGRYAGRVAQWDVVNEPLVFSLVSGELDTSHVFSRLLGPSYIAEAFHLAHAADPAAQLFLNETSIYFGGARFDALMNLVSGLLADGVPVHGVGLQTHLGTAPFDRAVFQDSIQRIADLGLLVEITELDVPFHPIFAEARDLQSQARIYRDVVEACLAVGNCTGITTWGVDDGHTWLDTFPPFDILAPHFPLLFDAAYQPKPAYHEALAAYVAAVPEPGLALLGAISLAAGSVAARRQRGLRRVAAPAGWRRSGV